MRLDPVAVSAVAVLLVLLSLAATQLSFVLDDPEVVVVGAPLHKNAGLQLAEGEVYRYRYISSGSETEMVYEVHGGPGCTMISIPEAYGGAAVCLDQGGELAAGPESGLGDPTVVLFRPWMLALNDSWRWSSSLYLSFSNSQAERVSETSYRVMRRDIYLGREAFVVEIKAEPGETEYQWVDAEKRITLRIIGDGYEIVLSDPPA